MSASTLVTVQILDVNDNSPVLVGDYSWKYLCTPRWEDQALVLASRDSDGPQHGGRLNFSLRSDAMVRRNWKLTPINGECMDIDESEFNIRIVRNVLIGSATIKEMKTPTAN